jgi:hypothetical protein
MAGNASTFGPAVTLANVCAGGHKMKQQDFSYWFGRARPTRDPNAGNQPANLMLLSSSVRQRTTLRD